MKYLIVGLGNPGDEYANTRHNIGFVVADAFTIERKASFESGRYASVARTTLKGRTFIVIKPTTFMNLSGVSVQEAKSFYKILDEDLLVLCDDLSLPLGKLRFRARGSSGGTSASPNGTPR